jgi:hypothetical protein
MVEMYSLVLIGSMGLAATVVAPCTYSGPRCSGKLRPVVSPEHRRARLGDEQVSVAGAREQAPTTVPLAGDQAVAVVLDLVNSLQSLGRLGSKRSRDRVWTGDRVSVSASGNISQPPIQE